jgi:hypothetical protein
METVRLKVAARGWRRVAAFAGLDDHVEIGDRGVRPSSKGDVWLPLGTIRSITVDLYSGSTQGALYRDCPTAHLTDGRMALLVGLNRDWRRRTEHVLIRRGEESEWTAFDGGDGTAWAWGEHDDDELISRLTALLSAAGALGTGDADVAATITLRSLEGYPPDPQIYSLPDLLRALRPKIHRHRRWLLTTTAR